MNSLTKDSIRQEALHGGALLPVRHRVPDSTYVMPSIPDSLCYKPTLLMRPAPEHTGNKSVVGKFKFQEYQSQDTTHYYHLNYEETSGYSGTEMDYDVRSDDVIGGLLVFIFVIVGYIFYHNYNAISRTIKKLFMNREEQNYTIEEVRSKVFLQFACCLMWGLLTFYYYLFTDSDMTLNDSLYGIPERYWFMGAFACLFIIYYVVKWLGYCFIGWIFFDVATRKEWIRCYSVNIYLVGFILFPVVLLITYSNLMCEYALIFIVILVVLSKILMFYEALKLFLKNFYGLFYIFPYFCALEIVPLLLLIELLNRTYVTLLIKL